MININGTDVKIAGNANEILYELTALKISIMQDEGLMEIDQEAMKQAIQVYKDHDYRFPEVRKFCPNCGARMVEPQESKENENG